jgi:hypothetical protein
MDQLADTLSLQGLPLCELYWNREFYMAYPRIMEFLPPELIGPQDLTESIS